MFLHIHSWEYSRSKDRRFVNRKCKKCQKIQYDEQRFNWLDSPHYNWKNYSRDIGIDWE